MATGNLGEMASTSRTSTQKPRYTGIRPNEKDMVAPSLFDLFYEEFLTQLMNTTNLADTVPEDFMRLQTDIDRVEYLMQLRPFAQEFEIASKIGLKSVEKSQRFREEGNKLFNADQGAQSVLFYNNALAFAPHPAFDERPPEEEDCKKTGTGVLEDNITSKTLKKPPPSKYESLAFCYANRSAALRKLSQYEDCLKDIARAAKFGYPKENIFKLWERKGKCYQGLKRFDMAVKCFRQSLQTLNDSSLNDTQRSQKSNEIQGLIRDLRTTHFFLSGTMSEDLGDKSSDEIFQMSMGPEPPLMGATGPIVIIPDPDISKRKLSTMTLPTSEGTPTPAKPERRSFRRKKTVREKIPPSSLPSLPNSGEDSSSLGGGSRSESQTSLNRQSGNPQPPGETGGELRKATSQMSISQLSGTGIKPDIEIPELSYGFNTRMPSASAAIELRFTPEKGRFFIASQDLSPGDVVLREEPYAAVLEAIFRVNHCAHCLKKTSTPIPCYGCATVQYCCETCRDQSWTEYHRFECGILGYLEPSRYLGKMPHLALRIITRTGMQNLIQHSMVSLLPTLKNGDQAENVHHQHHQQPSSSTMFDPTSYRSVHNLATNSDKRPFEDLIKKTCIAIFMAKCLKFNGFFGEKDSATQNTRRAEIFVSSLLLRHLQIASTNGLEMAECILKNNDVTKFDIIPVGGAIFPTMSFFNHSCYPNAMRLGYQSFQVVRIIKSVTRGEEVNIDYGFDFYANPIETRIKRAQTQYYFTCSCLACTNRWPVYNDLVTKSRTLKMKLTAPLAEEIERQATAYQIGMDFLLKLDIPTAMPIFRDYLIVMNDVVEHPDARYIDCEEAYKQCLWLENRGYKARIPPLSPMSQTSVGSSASSNETYRQFSQS